ncbi:uncharacterized protein [Fopius arisanus]|uniref:Uncharacterized protein n=1 Tax=Fopius arisanus TaxID=64838 RepID=A0A9R1TMA1_9HYME|nr:PREDICTED: uncharacterized protein LOC105271951 [Fopius arisanus]
MSWMRCMIRIPWKNRRQFESLDRFSCSLAMKFLHFLGVLFVVLCTINFSMQQNRWRQSQCKHHCRDKKLSFAYVDADNYYPYGDDVIYYRCHCLDKSIRRPAPNLYRFVIKAERQPRKLECLKNV